MVSCLCRFFMLSVIVYHRVFYKGRFINIMVLYHDINERDYKVTYGLDLKKGICSEESSEKTRIKTLENFDKVIKNNLINKGSESRFKKGDKGRTKEQVSEQTRNALVKHAKTNVSTEKRVELGKKLGKSGLGNKAKWNKNGK